MYALFISSAALIVLSVALVLNSLNNFLIEV
jgi:hypothetical protein